jgi:hypothetical protein
MWGREVSVLERSAVFAVLRLLGSDQGKQKRRRILLIGLVFLALFGGAFLWVAPGQLDNVVNPANFDRIELGMPLAEVVSILGGPPDMGTGAGDVNGWFGQDAILSVWLDGSERVIHKMYSPQRAHFRLRLIWKKLASMF